MKNSIIKILILLSINDICAQNDAYYWYGDKKISLQKDTSGFFAINASADKLKNIAVTSNKAMDALNWSVVGTALAKKRKKRSGNSEIYFSPTYFSAQNKNIASTNLMYVKLKTISDSNLLSKLLAKDSLIVYEKYQFLPLWTAIDCKFNSRKSAIELANEWYESGLFAAVEPDFVSKESIDHCTTDPQFPVQWALNNTGQSVYPGSQFGVTGIDIKACQAWTYTKGNPNIKIAIIDSKEYRPTILISQM